MRKLNKKRGNKVKSARRTRKGNQEYKSIEEGSQKAEQELETAIDRAIKTCISEHVLEDFFRNRGKEVKEAMMLEMMLERKEKLIREEECREGYDKGEEA